MTQSSPSCWRAKTIPPGRRSSLRWSLAKLDHCCAQNTRDVRCSCPPLRASLLACPPRKLWRPVCLSCCQIFRLTANWCVMTAGFCIAQAKSRMPRESSTLYSVETGHNFLAYVGNIESFLRRSLSRVLACGDAALFVASISWSGRKGPHSLKTKRWGYDRAAKNAWLPRGTPTLPVSLSWKPTVGGSTDATRRVSALEAELNEKDSSLAEFCAIESEFQRYKRDKEMYIAALSALEQRDYQMDAGNTRQAYIA